MTQAGVRLPLIIALGLAPLNVGQILAGRSELAGRWVHWVNVLHWPAADEVQPGDLVLTTAVAPDRADSREFLRQIVASTAAALVIRMPNDVRLTGVLPEIIETANSCNFPVILLPWEVPFADVTKSLLTRLLIPAGVRVGAGSRGASVADLPTSAAVGLASMPAPRPVGPVRRSQTLDGPGVGAELLRASSRQSGRVRVQVALGYPPERRAAGWSRQRDLFLTRLEAMARRGGASVRTQRSDEVLVVVLENDAADESSLRSFLEQAGRGEEIAHWVVTDTASQDGESPGELQFGQRIVREQQRSFESQSLESLTLLGVLAQNEHVATVVTGAVGSLVAYDRDHRTNLMETVDVYLDEACNTSAAARRLFLNRHSLMYRLAKVETLTGFSLREPTDRFFLQTAVRLHRFRLLQGEPSTDRLAAVDDDALPGDE